MTDVALSTMWGIQRFNTLDEFFKQARALGFNRFELNHAIDSKMMAGMNGYKIASVHEPCPADVSVNELKNRNWLVSATDQVKRRKGVEAIQRSIDLAVKLGASTVIVHPGKVDIDTALDTKLRDLYHAGKVETPQYQKLKLEHMEARVAQARFNLSAVRQSIIELAEYADERGIKLGLENRYHYFEIPSPDELDTLLNLGFKNVGFWYDVGHAETLERMGYYAHEEWLRRFSTRIIGTHLHDVIGIDDHQSPGSGQIDWAMVAHYLPADALRTCEFQNFNSAEQVAAGLRWLKEKECI
ncbi:MAG: sugar phosphate isomerase/epimerase [Chloroflexi bacterium]|nr:sugar phosphate isomerase/epimerase [Chloroflexota bacterium]